MRRIIADQLFTGLLVTEKQKETVTHHLEAVPYLWAWTKVSGGTCARTFSFVLWTLLTGAAN